MRYALWILILAGCSRPAPGTDPVPEAADPVPRSTRVDPVIARATAALEKRDLAGARALLGRERWLSDEPDAASLLYSGCLMAERRHAEAVDALRTYLSKTARLKRPGDRIAVHLLRHHASGGGERARSPREACYFGLYAWSALDEPATARPDLERARRDAPRPERALAALVELP